MFKPNKQEREFLQMNTARQNEKIQYYFNCIESIEERIEKIIVSHERGEINEDKYDSRLRYFNDSISKYLRRIAECEEQKDINAKILARSLYVTEDGYLFALIDGVLTDGVDSHTAHLNEDGRVCFQYTPDDISPLELFEDSNMFNAARVYSFWTRFTEVENL